MNRPPSSVGDLKAYDGSSKLPIGSGSLKSKILRQGPSALERGGRTKIGSFNPKSLNWFIFTSSFTGSSTDQAKQTNFGGVSILKLVDSDDEDQNLEDDVNLNGDEMDEEEKKTQSHPVESCCRQNYLRFKEEEEIFGQGNE